MRTRGFGLLLLVIVTGFALAACSHSPRNPSINDSNYVDMVVPLISGCSAEPAIDEAALGRNLKREASAWNAIQAPSSLASLHTAYAKALEKAADEFLRSPTTPASPDAYLSFNASQMAYRDWYSAFNTKYPDRLFSVEGSSMEPTFHNGVLLPIDAPRRAVGRWEIVIFKFPLDPSRDFIKRVVGLPREKVEVHNAKIYVNGRVLDGDTYAKDTTDYTYGPVTVPDDSYFVLGDNRNNSFDSHSWRSSCPQQQCDFVAKNLILGVLPRATTGCRTAPTD